MVLGTAIPLVDPSKAEHTNGTEKQYADTEDDIFELDEEQLVKHDPGEDKHTPTVSMVDSYIYRSIYTIYIYIDYS